MLEPALDCVVVCVVVVPCVSQLQKTKAAIVIIPNKMITSFITLSNCKWLAKESLSALRRRRGATQIDLASSQAAR